MRFIKVDVLLYSLHISCSGSRLHIGCRGTTLMTALYGEKATQTTAKKLRKFTHTL